MSKRQKFNLFYYSQFPLVLLSFMLTCSISAVLYSSIQWNVVLLIGLSTYFTYTIDNLIDWNKDKTQYQSISTFIVQYHKLTYFLLPIVGISIIFLVLKSSNEFIISLLLLGAFVAMGTTRFAKYRENSSDPTRSLRHFFLNRLFISLIWSIVCIFVPIWYDNQSINALTWHTFFYTFFLIFVYAVLWKFERSPNLLKKRLVHSGTLPYLRIFPILSSLIVIYDIAIGIRSAINLANILPPTIVFLATIIICRNPVQLRYKITLFSTAMSISIVFSLLLHLVI
jgi:hypothetical protein